MIESSQDEIRILVAEKFDLIRIGLRALFQDHASMHLVAEASNIDDLFKMVTDYQPDVALIDLQLSGWDDAEHISKLTHIYPQTKVLAFSDCINEQINLLAFHAGAAGIISKHHSIQSLLNAIAAIHAGETRYYCDAPKLEQQAQSNPGTVVETQTDDDTSGQLKFSNCERRIAILACQGLSAREISLQLDITEKTVRNQLSVIYRKIGVKKQIELCLIASQFNYFK